MKAPDISVGILSDKKITFTLNDEYIDQENKTFPPGEWIAYFQDDTIILSSNMERLSYSNEVILHPSKPSHTFELHNVIIGIDFHWERRENQVFKGGLKLLIEENLLTAINFLSVEDYLISVISAEMSATSSSELLKAHAVISRSWLLAQIEKNINIQSGQKNYDSFVETESERIRWYDREDHMNFDVCADDHCQRYQGITRATTLIVEQAVGETYGQILTFKGQICDARFSKCCGGIAEIFENVWEPVNHPYLQKIVDNDADPEGYSLQIEEEAGAERWILGNPDSFCNTTDKKVLSQVLNDYDQETMDFFRWEVKYSQKELSNLVSERTGISFGEITDLIPIERGVSSRLKKLKIIGTKKTLMIGKELEIRKTLSKSHLYSSAFIVEKKEESGDMMFILHGAGWGHGVGLCQIGAAVMGEKGYDYGEILRHYFRGAKLEKRY
ncbi:SpoIID/LytB domain-containing protein [Bacteroidota bacterium]